ncbi:hypothetical protein Trydic_g12824 [Trypoxylus dichotomus]
MPLLARSGERSKKVPNAPIIKKVDEDLRTLLSSIHRHHGLSHLHLSPFYRSRLPVYVRAVPATQREGASEVVMARVQDGIGHGRDGGRLNELK